MELTPTGRTEVGTLFELTSDVDSALNGMSKGERDAVARFLTAINASFERRGEEALPE